MKSAANAVDELDYYINENETTSRGLKLMRPVLYGTHKMPISPTRSSMEIEDFIEYLRLAEAVRRLHFRKLRGEIDAEFDIDRNEKLNSTMARKDYELLPPPPPFSVPQT